MAPRVFTLNGRGYLCASVPVSDFDLISRPKELPKCRRHCVQLGGTCSICSTFLGHQIQNGSEHIRLQALLESWSGQVIDYFSYDTAKRADDSGATSARKQKSHQAGLEQLCQLQL